MEKANIMYVIGPPIKISGKKKISRVREALRNMGVNPDLFEFGWEFNIPVPKEDGIIQFRLLTSVMENARVLPADFAEMLEDILFEAPIPANQT